MKAEAEKLIARYNEIQAGIFSLPKAGKLARLREVAEIARRLADMGVSLPGVIEEDQQCHNAKNAEQKSSSCTWPAETTCHVTPNPSPTLSKTPTPGVISSQEDTGHIGAHARTQTTLKNETKREGSAVMENGTITRVITKDFKNLSIDTPLAKRTVLLGPNGSGKSAHAEALQLALLGYIPGGEKTNAGILDTYGSADSLWVGLEINGIRLGRQFKRFSSTGSVTQTFYKGKTKIKKDEFVSLLAENGAPVVLDVAEFMSLSDQKKIDYVFELYPPAGDIADLDEKIAQVKERINGYHANIRDAEKSIQRLTADVGNIKLPAGTLAEITEELRQVDEELQGVRHTINEEHAAIEKAKVAELEAELEAKKQEEADAKARMESDRGALEKERGRLEELEEKAEAYKKAVGTELQADGHIAAESIRKIIAVMDDAGCELCAARMVAKVELKKFV